MKWLPAAVCGFLCPMGAFAQVTVLETETHAHLVNGETTIALGLRNASGVALSSRIELQWLGPAGEAHGMIRQRAVVSPGDSSLDIPLPLLPKYDPLLDRLRYVVSPGEQNYTAFTTTQGILNFVNIAGYAFSMGVVVAGLPREDQPYEIRVSTFHPATGRPVAGVKVRAEKATAVSDQNGIALLRVETDPDSDGEELEIQASVGDFHQEAQTPPLQIDRGDIQIYTDKPLYQPGQTMHVRILARGAGSVRAGLEHEIRILDSEDNLEHAAMVTTSRFGLAWTDWPIPSNAKSGKYKIAVEGDEFDGGFQRTVEIRRYELPSFRVNAKPDRTYYLAQQKAMVVVSGEYLFGKPVAGGTLRITEGDGDSALVKGKLDQKGQFTATLDTGFVDDETRFVDRHFTAFITDSTTNRTEQHKFDLRVSRESVHLYVVKSLYLPASRRVYVTTDLPDGTPAVSQVELVNDGKVLGRGTTNRFGLARIDFPEGSYDDLMVRAMTADGRSAQEDTHFENLRPEIWLETTKSLYRAGETVHCRVAATVKDLPVLLIAWNDKGQTVFSRNLTLQDGHAQFDIPYSSHFGRKLSVGVASGATSAIASRAVLVPGQDDLVVSASPVKTTYHPGDLATVQFRAPADTALGIAIVDQSVLERAATDAAFGQRRWFDYDIDGEPNLAGMRESDLEELDPAKIDGDLQLAAEVLIPDPFFANSGEDTAEEARESFSKAGVQALAPVKNELDARYLETLDYPRNEAELFAAVGKTLSGIQDPWMRAYYPVFSTERENDVLQLMSTGPDKKIGTRDDFCALTVKRKWFGNYEALIGNRLRGMADYPATREEVLRLLGSAGIQFAALRDPWGSPMDLQIAYERQWREIRILSAGPDRKFGTNDDFTVATFWGSYFAGLSERINAALGTWLEFPRTSDQFRTALRAAGVDFDGLRDPWGHVYFPVFRTDETYADHVNVYSYSEYKGAVENKKKITPTKRTTLIIEIRSNGEDGIQGTYDDFAVAEFSRVLENAADAPKTDLAEKLAQPTDSIPGTGTISGVVTDPSGAVIPGVQVTLNGIYTTKTDNGGRYSFRGVHPGLYLLGFDVAGFMHKVINKVPAAADHLTRADATLQVGEVTNTVEVSAESVVINTDLAVARGIAANTALSTPRVREYFPETLFWQPELVTNAAGRASIQVKLADSITTWHVAVIASTLDGRITETKADFRAFQPFQADLDAPRMLTAGDEILLPAPIRNYLDQAENVTVSATVAAGLSLPQGVRQPGVVARESSSDAFLLLHADGATDHAKLRVTAIGGRASDAIEKPVSVHPDGEPREVTVSGMAAEGSGLSADVPLTVVPGSIVGEVKFYPSLLSRILESMQALLQRPWGCGEQTISSTYPNLLLLKALKDAGIKDDRLEAKATKNLRDGYERLLGYQSADGGFTYWGHGDEDVALTAYALAFLRDAREFTEVDGDRVTSAQKWLGKQETKEIDTHALQIRALAQAGPKFADDIDRRLEKMAREAAEYDHPYAIAAFILAALDAGKAQLAEPGIERLCKMARDEQGAAYWSLEANTPFYGWGRAGQVETTAMVVSALAGWRKVGHSDAMINALIDRGGLFLLKNTDGLGGWSTSQSTVRALTALLDSWGKAPVKPLTVEVTVNGLSAGKLSLPSGHVLQGPVRLDVSRWIQAGAKNQVSIGGTGGQAVQAQFHISWFEKWGNPRKAKNLSLEAHFSSLTPAVNEAVTCEVAVSRPAFRGYGMMIADIGLPPGAEVDRGTLQSVADDPRSGVDSFEVAPGHVIFYVWPRAADSRFQFVFRPRFAMTARGEQSVLYDYYNPDERVVRQPETFTVSR
jgi:hypothetical protein